MSEMALMAEELVVIGRAGLSQRGPLPSSTALRLTGLLFAQLAIGVLGVLTMSAEYGTGTIQAALAAVPNRPLVLAAKTLVFATVSGGLYLSVLGLLTLGIATVTRHTAGAISTFVGILFILQGRWVRRPFERRIAGCLARQESVRDVYQPRK